MMYPKTKKMGTSITLDAIIYLLFICLMKTRETGKLIQNANPAAI